MAGSRAKSSVDKLIFMDFCFVCLAEQIIQVSFPAVVVGRIKNCDVIIRVSEIERI